MKRLLTGTLPRPVGTHASTKVSRADYTLNSFSRDLTEYLRWKRVDVTAVAGDHWLLNYLIIAISKLGFGIDLPPRELFQRIDYLTDELSRAFGFTSEYNAGRLHVGDNGAMTIYLLGKSPNREMINQTTPYWEMTPLRYLSHSSTSFSLGNNAEPEEYVGSGFDVIEIDIGILHLMAVKFLEFWRYHNPEAPRNLQMLIAMDILPRLKLSQYGITMMNCMTCLVKGVTLNTSKVHLAKSFPDRHRDIHNYLSKYKEVLLGRELLFEQAIGAIDMPLDADPFKTLSFDEYAYSRQINWALMITRYNLLDYLFAICRVDPERVGRWTAINDIKRTIKLLENDSAFNVALPMNLRRELREKIGVLKATMG